MTFILTCLNLTHSLQLINEELDIKRANQRKIWSWVLGASLWTINFIVVLAFWKDDDETSSLEAWVTVGFYFT